MRQVPKTKSLHRRKEELYQRSSQYKSALTSDINELKIDLKRWGQHALIIGGSLYVAYKLVKLFRGSQSEETVEENPQAMVVTKESSFLVTKIKEQIMLFLLAIAVNKLKEFINNQKDD